MKTVVVFEAGLTPKCDWVYTPRERRRLAGNSSLQHGTWMWRLGRFERSDITGCESRKLVGKNREGCSTTLIAGRLVIQALTVRRPEIPFRSRRGPWHHLLRQIWPVNWPPLKNFNEEKLETLKTRFIRRQAIATTSA
jgi:hypothetical protein